MKKNGFIFIESIVVLVIVILSLTLMLSNYYLLIRKSKSNEYYDLPKDKYLLYNIGNLGEKDNPYNAPGGSLSFKATKSNCNNYMSNRISNCSQLFSDTNLEYFIIINNLNTEFSDPNISSKYDSPTIEYLKTLRRCRDQACTEGIGYAVGVFKRNNEYFYASLEL